MHADDEDFFRDFFQALSEQPLDFDDGQAQKYYVPLYEDPALVAHDPVKHLANPIRWSKQESVQLFSGFRGSGKSTELRRLQHHLRGLGNYHIVLCDVEDYLSLSMPLDVSTFLMVLAGSFGEALYEERILPSDPGEEGYWSRLWNFLARTKVDISELSATMPGQPIGAALKASFKDDPSFREKLQKVMEGHLGALVRDVREFFKDCVKKVQRRHGNDARLVFLVDSMEHIRGTSTNAKDVQASVENLFAGHADKLRLPGVHVVYTVPPYLKVLRPNLSSLYASGYLQMLPALKVRDRGTEAPFTPVFELLQRVIRARGDWRRLLGDDRGQLDALILASGGHLRDLLRIFMEILRRADQLPVPEQTIWDAVNQVRSEFLPIADADAEWLARIAETHEAALPSQDRLPDFARFLDSNMVLCYRNGMDWYDTHPLVAELVKEQAEKLKRQRANGAIPRAES